MYEDLVKSLKICGTPALINEKCIAFHDGCCEAEPVCMYELMRKAADAIEELSRDLDSMNDANIALYGALPKWIPVTERLPEIGETVLVLAYGDDAFTAKMLNQTEYGYTVFECSGFFRELAKPGRITHWTPLPELPKEGE